MKKYLDIIIRYLNYLISYCISRFVLDREVSKIMSISNIKNEPVDIVAERKWKDKWKILSQHVNVKFYRLYSQFCGNDINIVPDDVCHNIIETILNPVKYRAYYEDKNMFDRILKLSFSNIRVTPDTILRNIQGRLYDCKYNVIDNAEYVLNKKQYTSLIVKPTVGSSSGKGITFFRLHGDGYRMIGNESVLLTIDYLKSNYGDNYIVQNVVKQSVYMSQFCETSVNTIRVQVYRSVLDGTIYVENVAVRVGKLGSLVDNAHAGGYFVGVNKATGEFDKFVSNQYRETLTNFNGIDYQNGVYILPNYQEILSFSKKVMECVPHHHLLALDIMLDENDSPVLIEYNISAFGLWLFQLIGRLAFGDHTDEIIEYCANNKQCASRIYVTF